MAKNISKRALKEIVENAQTWCDHDIPNDHAQGHCDYVVITQEEITQILEDAS